MSLTLLNKDVISREVALDDVGEIYAGFFAKEKKFLLKYFSEFFPPGLLTDLDKLKTKCFKCVKRNTSIICIAIHHFSV